MSTPSGNDQGPSLLAASYSLIFLSAIAVTLRFYGRYVERKVGFWWDDWLSLVALVRHLQQIFDDSANIYDRRLFSSIAV